MMNDPVKLFSPHALKKVPAGGAAGENHHRQMDITI
jgi:hypothetical protein